MNFGEELRKNYNLNESEVESSSSDEPDDGEISAESKMGDYDGGIRAAVTVSSTFPSDGLMQSAASVECKAAPLETPAARGPILPASKNSDFTSRLHLGTNYPENPEQSDLKTSEQTSLTRRKSTPEFPDGRHMDVNVERDTLALKLTPVKNTALAKCKLTPTETKERWPEEIFGNKDSGAAMRQPTHDASRINISSTLRGGPVEIPIQIMETTGKTEFEAGRVRKDSQSRASEAAAEMYSETTGKERFGCESTEKVTTDLHSHQTSAIDRKDSAIWTSESQHYQNSNIVCGNDGNGRRNETLRALAAASPSTTDKAEAHVASSSNASLSKFRQKWETKKMTDKAPEHLYLESGVSTGKTEVLHKSSDSCHRTSSSSQSAEAKDTSAELRDSQNTANTYANVFKSSSVPFTQTETVCQMKNDDSKRWAERITPSYRKTSNAVQENVITTISLIPPDIIPSTEVTDMYHIFMADKICGLNLKNFDENVYKKLEEDFQKPNGLVLNRVSTNIRENFQCLLDFVAARVMKAEELFEDAICFPVRIELDKQLRTVFDIPPALITALPDNFISVLQACIQECRDEYRQRNRKIVELEEEVLNLLLEQAVAFYQEELKYQIIESPQGRFTSKHEFIAKETKVRQLTEDSFFEACDNVAWKLKYKDVLNDKLSLVQNKVEELNRNKEILIACRDESVRIYHDTLDVMQAGTLSERLTSFSNYDKAAREQAVSAYQKFVHDSASSASLKKLYECLEIELGGLLDEACNDRRKILVKEETAARKKEEKVRREEIERKKRNETEDDWKQEVLKWENEKTGEQEANEALEERTEPLRSVAHEVARTKSDGAETQLVSSPYNRESNFEAAQSDNFELLAVAASPKRTKHPKAEHQCTNENNMPLHSDAYEVLDSSASPIATPSPPLLNATGIVIPSAELAIHLGLNRTRVGYVIPATGKLSVVADVKNCLYRSDLRYTVAFSPNEVNGLGKPAVDFKGFILHEPTDKLHVVVSNGRQTHLRLQEIIARFFLSLRHKAEMVLKMHFPKCVIAVPQCLNDMQRCCIEDGATISGFEGFQFVNDTNAVAVAFVVDSEKKLGNIVVVNGSEKTFDIASFNFNSGALQCHNVTGPCFQTNNSERGLLRGVVHEAKKALFGENPAKKYFTPKELGVSPSSPNTTYLMLDGPYSALEDYRNAVYKNTAGRKDGLIYMDSHAVVRGAAYLSCLRSRDPCNAMLHLWKEKLQAHRGTRPEKLLQEVEDNIISQKNRIAKRSKIQQRGGVLTANEVLHHCKALSSEYASTLHNARMDVLNMMFQLEMELSRLQASTQRKEYESHLERIHGQLKTADLTMEQLRPLRNEIMTMISDL